LNIPFPVFPIVGPATLAEMDSSLGAMELELSDAEIAWLNLETDGNPL
jgi:aryl-alcohol dehydrogenase-like predicted oxidoreductase